MTEPCLWRASSSPRTQPVAIFLSPIFFPFSGVPSTTTGYTQTGMPTVNLELYLILLDQSDQSVALEWPIPSHVRACWKCASPRITAVCISGGNVPWQSLPVVPKASWRVRCSTWDHSQFLGATSASHTCSSLRYWGSQQQNHLRRSCGFPNTMTTTGNTPFSSGKNYSYLTH